MGLGAVPLRSLGLLQRLLGLVSAQPVQQESQLVASRTRSFCVVRLLVWKQLREHLLLVPTLLLRPGSLCAKLSAW
jgi:hypothetical protein